MSRQSDVKSTMQVRIDYRVHYYAKLKATEDHHSLRSVLDTLLCDWLDDYLPLSIRNEIKHHVGTPNDE